MKQSLSETEELHLLLELVSEARQQIEAGGQPVLSGFLKAKGVSQEEIEVLIDRWTQLITELINETPTIPITLSERKDHLHTSAMCLLFSVLIPDFKSRLVETAVDSHVPENERRSVITLSPEEMRRLLHASLVAGTWAE